MLLLLLLLLLDVAANNQTQFKGLGCDARPEHVPEEMMIIVNILKSKRNNKQFDAILKS